MSRSGFAGSDSRYLLHNSRASTTERERDYNALSHAESD